MLTMIPIRGTRGTRGVEKVFNVVTWCLTQTSYISQIMGIAATTAKMTVKARCQLKIIEAKRRICVAMAAAVNWVPR